LGFGLGITFQFLTIFFPTRDLTWVQKGEGLWVVRKENFLRKLGVLGLTFIISFPLGLGGKKGIFGRFALENYCAFILEPRQGNLSFGENSNLLGKIWGTLL